MVATTAISQRDYTDSVVAALEAAGITVGRGVRLDDSGSEISPPCAVVHPIPGGQRSGTVDDWTVNADLVYQISCVGETHAAAEQVYADVDVVMTGGAITVPGRYVDVVAPRSGSVPVLRDDDIGQPNLYFTATPRYRLDSTAA